MKVQVVVGANYGDEGKGLVSGCLAREASRNSEKVLTVFYNGTMQRAHTFENEIHRCMAAGTNYGSDTFYHEKFVIDPISLLILQARPIIDGACRIILPCDVLKNRQVEKNRGAARHGSCGFGLFEAVKRSENPNYRIIASDLLDTYNLYQKLKEIEKVYPAPNDDVYNLHNFMTAVNYIVSKCKIEEFEDVTKRYDRIIFEGGQGLMLDQTNKDCFPHLTPSSTGNYFISEDIKRIGVVPELFYVSRSYLTRHGAGPLSGECSKEDINPEITDATNLENEWQGKLRFGKIDTESMNKRIIKDASYYDRKTINLVFTQLNYTNNKLETISGRKDIIVPWADNIYVSDQKDKMEIFRLKNN